MPITTEQDIFAYFSGEMFIGVRDAITGKATAGMRYLGEISKSEIQFTSNVIQIQEHKTGQALQIKKFNNQKRAKFNATLKNLNPENWALAQLGTFTTVTGATLAAAAGPVICTASAANSYYALGYLNVTGLVLTWGATAAAARTGTVAVLNTDYTVDLKTGMVKVLGGAITAGSFIVAAFTFPSQRIVSSFTAAQTEFYVKFAGTNALNVDSALNVDIFKLSLDPVSAASLISDTNEEVLQLTGDVLYDSLQGSGTLYGNFLYETIA